MSNKIAIPPPSIRQSALLYILFFFLSGIIIFFTSLHIDKSDRIKKFQDIISAISIVRGYQGLILDTPGIGSIIIGIVEKTEDVYVQKIKITRPKTQSLIREFYPNSDNFFINRLTSIVVKARFEDYTITADLLLPNLFIHNHLITAIFLSSLLTGCLTLVQFTKRKQEELFLAKRMGDLAKQISHDIRSPLAALQSISSRLSQLPEDDRILVRSAVTRIMDIANNLLKHGKHTHHMDQTLTNQFIPCLINSVLSEKRQQHYRNSALTIDFPDQEKSYGCFSRIHPVEFKRVISNLINNAIEALSGQGRIWLDLSQYNQELVIQIHDNGRGIPASVLAKLANKGFSHAKPEGNGLGLYHARKSVTNWGGSLEIRSQLGQGCTVIIRLPSSRPPNWFVKSVQIHSNSCLIILDDDSSIHQVWKKKLEFITSNCSKIELLHLTTSEQLKSHVTAQKINDNDLFFIDYELLDNKSNGLEIIDELQLHKQSLLVTSRFEEFEIQKKCSILGIGLLPKEMVEIVPIEIINQHQESVFHAILIDDDELVHFTWQMAAKNCGKKLKCYFDPHKFLSENANFSREIPIYIDSNLGEEMKGEDFINRFIEIGFRSIFIASGFDADYFKSVEKISGVVGKSPPKDFFVI